MYIFFLRFVLQGDNHAATMEYEFLDVRRFWIFVLKINWFKDINLY